MKTCFNRDEFALLWTPRSPSNFVLPYGHEWQWRGRWLRHKPGGHTDGLSSPQFLHAFKGGDPWGWAAPAAVAHDGAYHRAIQESFDCGETWQDLAVPLTKDESDQMFYDLLLVLAEGTPDIADRLARTAHALVYYEAVHLAGQEAWAAAGRY